MMVDVVTPGFAPQRSLYASTDIPGFLAAHDRLLRLSFDRFLGGHGRIGTKADIRAQRDYLRDLRRAAVQAIGSVEFDEAARGVDSGICGPPTTSTSTRSRARALRRCRRRGCRAWAARTSLSRRTASR
jgi:hypothetical protein